MFVNKTWVRRGGYTVRDTIRGPYVFKLWFRLPGPSEVRIPSHLCGLGPRHVSLRRRVSDILGKYVVQCVVKPVVWGP